MSQNTPFRLGAGGAPPAHHSQGTPTSHAPAGGPAAASATVPGVDLSALQGVSPEQITLIAQLLQSGALSLPLAPAAAPAPSASTAPTPGPVHSAPTPAGDAKDVDMDKEDGELEEGEERDVGNEAPSARDVQPPPQRRPASAKAHLVSPPHAQQRVSKPSAPPPAAALHARRPLDKGAVARNFILQMHRAGYTFDQLAKEVPNTKALRRIYHALGLALPPDDAPAAVNGSAASPGRYPHGDDAIPSSTLAPTAETRKASAAKKQLPPAKPATVDRQEYLARLKAVNAKTGSSKQPAGSKPTEKSADLPSIVPPIAKSKVKTDLVKQRLEKLKAEAAAKTSAALASSDVPISSTPGAQTVLPSDRTLGSGPGDIATRASQATSETNSPAPIPAEPPQVAHQQPVPPPAPSHPPAASPTQLGTIFSPTPGRPFGSLPGLFMSTSAAQASTANSVSSSGQTISTTAPPASSQPPRAMSQIAATSPAASPSPLNVPRKRPVAADFDNDVPTSSAPSPSKRVAFGQSRSNSTSERIVIEVSEDEGEDDDHGEPAAARQSKPGLLSHFPPKWTMSAPATPGSTTPISAAELEEKQKAIEALNRKIAEYEARKAQGKANGKGAASGQASVSGLGSGQSVSAISAESDKPGSPVIGVEASELNGSKAASPQSSISGRSARAIARDQEMSILQQRYKELRQQIKGHDSPGELPRPDTLSAAEAAPNEPAPMDVTEENTGPPIHPYGGPMDSSSDESGEISSDSAQGVLVDDGMAETETTTGHMSQPEIAAEEPSGAGNELDATQASESAPLQVAGGVAHPVDAIGPPVGTEPAVAVNASTANDRPDESTNDLELARDEPMDEGSSDEEDDGSDDLDAPVPEDSNAPLTATASVTVQNAEEQNNDESDVTSGEDESSDALSSDADEEDESDYEPEMVTPDVVQGGDQAPSSEVPSTVSDVHPRPGEPDDLAPELLPPQAESAEDEGPSTRTYFTPYQSPLAQFKDYRYHTDYLHNVPGGFRSMTYSNDIDPNKPLCRFEAMGGKCNDPNCKDQHFRTMGLTDSLLIQNLATRNPPTRTPADEKRWRDGLNALIKQLKTSDQSADAHSIAARIAEFRRSFVGDSSKTLRLD